MKLRTSKLVRAVQRLRHATTLFPDRVMAEMTFEIEAIQLRDRPHGALDGQAPAVNLAKLQAKETPPPRMS